MHRDDARVQLHKRAGTQRLTLGWGAAFLFAAGCSSGGADAIDMSDRDGAVGATTPDLSTRPDASSPPVDLSFTMVKPCSWRDHFAQLYGHAFSPADVAFVTTDNAVTRGVDQLDFAAQKNRDPNQVQVKGKTSFIKELRLLTPGGNTVLGSRTGAYVYGLGYAMWLEVNGSGETGLAEATLVRQFAMEEP